MTPGAVASGLTLAAEVHRWWYIVEHGPHESLGERSSANVAQTRKCGAI